MRSFSSVRDLQLPVAMLRVSRRRREHHVRAARPARPRFLRQRNLLPRRGYLHHRFPAFLQAGNAAVLSHQAAMRFHHHIPTGALLLR